MVQRMIHPKKGIKEDEMEATALSPSPTVRMRGSTTNGVVQHRSRIQERKLYPPATKAGTRKQQFCQADIEPLSLGVAGEIILLPFSS